MNEKYTVIGFWYEDEPEVAGVVKGDCGPVMGGTDLLDDNSEGFQGAWAEIVEAADADSAQALAVERMLHEEAEDDDADDDLDYEDTDPAEDVPGLLDASGTVPADVNTPNRIEDDPWWQKAVFGQDSEDAHPGAIEHDTVREQTGEDA